MRRSFTSPQGSTQIRCPSSFSTGSRKCLTLIIAAAPVANSADRTRLGPPLRGGRLYEQDAKKFVKFGNELQCPEPGIHGVVPAALGHASTGIPEARRAAGIHVTNMPA